MAAAAVAPQLPVRTHSTSEVACPTAMVAGFAAQALDGQIIDPSHYFLPTDLLEHSDLLAAQGHAAEVAIPLRVLNGVYTDDEEDFNEDDGETAEAGRRDRSDRKRRQRQQRRRRAALQAAECERPASGAREGTTPKAPKSPVVACEDAFREDDGDGVEPIDLGRWYGWPQHVVCRWHGSMLSAGEVSADGHVFAKPHVGPRKSHPNGVSLSPICMIFEQTLRVRGVHRYRYTILEGHVGAADGIGFVFDSRVRRKNIQRMKSVFLNKRGQVCLRNLESITKLPCSLPRLSPGSAVNLSIDLDMTMARFEMEDSCGKHCGAVDLSFASLFPDRPAVPSADPSRSGFFCAIVTSVITVSLH